MKVKVTYPTRNRISGNTFSAEIGNIKSFSSIIGKFGNHFYFTDKITETCMAIDGATPLELKTIAHNMLIHAAELEVQLGGEQK